jgi:hypothetical protein
MTTLVLFKSRCSRALTTAVEVSLVGCRGAQSEPLSSASSAQKVAVTGNDQGGPRPVLSALECWTQRDYASCMRPSSRSLSSGSFLGWAVLFLVLLPIVMIKSIGGAIAPEMVDSLSDRLRSYVAWAPASMLGGLKGVLVGLALLAVAIYAICLLYSVVRGDKSAERHPKRRRIA